jgi:hypothetical protein
MLVNASFSVMKFSDLTLDVAYAMSILAPNLSGKPTTFDTNHTVSDMRVSVVEGG